MSRGLPALLLLLAAAAVLTIGASADRGGRDERGGRDKRGGRNDDRGRAGPSACLLADADLAACPGNGTLTCENTAGDLVCMRGRNMTECPAPTDLDSVDRECREPRPLGCLLPENTTECYGNRTLTCENSNGDIVCVLAFNTTECPAPAELDSVDLECREPKPLGCLLPEDTTECTGNRTLMCENSAGDVVCVPAFGATECPAPAELDGVSCECHDCNRSFADCEDDDFTDSPFCGGNGRGMLGAPNGDRLRELADRLRAQARRTTSCLLADAGECPGNGTLACENTAGDVVCVRGRNLTDCPAPAELDQVDHECPMPRQLGCLLPENATECPGNRTLTCENSAGDVVCVPAFNATVCPAPTELDGVDRECRDCEDDDSEDADGEDGDGTDRPLRRSGGRNMQGTLVPGRRMVSL